MLYRPKLFSDRGVFGTMTNLWDGTFWKNSGFQHSTISTRSSILDVRQGSEYSSATNSDNRPYEVIKQPPRDIPRKRYSENMQQIYRRTPNAEVRFQ